ncbi:MAG: phosphoribosylformylglycinamidine cyclo-ligase [Spirochaetales bacterium]|nr:phosphoribosylformylglycinamidine cyclo-ligase [Spirochaetales bacterium]
MKDRKYEVNIDLANRTKKEMAESLRSDDARVLNTLGAFASLYDFSFPGYTDPVLVMKTEEPGSKQMLAFQHDKIEGICFDMIHHLINDCIVMGARPLIVQDAIICGKMEKEKIKRIVAAIAEACRNNECTLTGGETSEQPGILPEGTYILTSSIIGIVEKDAVIDGAKINTGHSIIGVESSGPHTNGYTMIRKVLGDSPVLDKRMINGKTFLETVLEPHRCYYTALKDLFPKKIISGLAHITGGGITENLNRILPGNLDAHIYLDKYRIPEVFKVIREVGQISDREMLRTFNMGIGLVAVTAEENAGRIMDHIKKEGFESYTIGEIKRGSQKVNTRGKLRW